VTFVDSTLGRIAVVAVGAYNVGRISAAFDRFWSGTGQESWVTNQNPPAPLHRHYEPPHEIETGAEIMAFHLGSTIVLLLEPGVTLRPDLLAGEEIRLGQVISL